MVRSMIRSVQARLVVLATDESGMSTVEYASVVFYTPDG
jgi:hypothetical protein